MQIVNGVPIEEVLVSEKDKDKLVKLCEEIKTILEKYPSTNNPNSDYATTMSRVKSEFSGFRKWVGILNIANK